MRSAWVIENKGCKSEKDWMVMNDDNYDDNYVETTSDTKKYNSRGILYLAHKSVRRDSYNDDYTLKTATQYADDILASLPDDAIYSTEIKW